MAKKCEVFVIREGKSLEKGERVAVYFNLHQGGFSIMALQGKHKGTVVAYSPFVTIENATFHINKNTLGKIIENNRKSVYAMVKGIYTGNEPINDSEYRKGYCNPYKTGKFIDWETKEELKAANNVYFYQKYFSYK